VSIKIKVRDTSETVVDDVQIHHQRHRTRRVRKVDSQVNIPKMSTRDCIYVSRFHYMCCTEEVRVKVEGQKCHPKTMRSKKNR
jgi:hypothetical protein